MIHYFHCYFHIYSQFLLEWCRSQQIPDSWLKITVIHHSIIFSVFFINNSESPPISSCAFLNEFHKRTYHMHGKLNLFIKTRIINFGGIRQTARDASSDHTLHLFINYYHPRHFFVKTSVSSTQRLWSYSIVDIHTLFPYSVKKLW